MKYTELKPGDVIVLNKMKVLIIYRYHILDESKINFIISGLMLPLYGVLSNVALKEIKSNNFTYLGRFKDVVVE